MKLWIREDVGRAHEFVAKERRECDGEDKMQGCGEMRDIEKMRGVYRERWEAERKIKKK